MESHCSFGMKWTPSGLPGSVAWLFLPQFVVAMYSHCSFVLRHEVDAIQLTRISHMALLAFFLNPTWNNVALLA
jgi:hypothetical protein